MTGTKILNSSYLIAGAPENIAPSLGADFAINFEDVVRKCSTQSYDVICFSLEKLSQQLLNDFIKIVLSNSPNSQIVIIKGNNQIDLLTLILSRLQVFRIVAEFDIKIEEILAEAQANFAQITQKQQLLKLLNEQNESLTKLSKELEDRVSKRQANTIKAREKIVTANQRTESLQRALIALHRAKTVAEIESLIKNAIADTLNVDWVKIDLFPANPFNQQLTTKKIAFSSPLYQGSDHMGQVLFGRNTNKPFSSNQENFLTQVAESISLALFRLNKQNHFEVLKNQWESSFDAITRPLSLVDNSYTIVRCNKSYAERAKQNINQVIGKKCYEVLFRRNQPCINCHLGNKFRLPKLHHSPHIASVYEVTSQSLHASTNRAPLYINLYHDITDELNYESQILDSSREAEIGLIGSSIAHELNNPLAGILSFVQLIKMDLKGNESYYNDILEMERATLRCKDIITNLLGFSRTSNISESGLIDINEVIKQSKNIFQLRAKSRGVDVVLELPSDPQLIEGQFNLLAQAMGHLMTMALMTIAKERMKDRTLKSILFIKLIANSNSYAIEFNTSTDIKSVDINPPNVDLTTLKESISLDLQVTSQIIKDHLGQLEINSLDKFFQARVKFPRPETQPKSQDVDRQI